MNPKQIPALFAFLSADARAPADAIRITLAIGAFTGTNAVAQMAENKAAWQCQTDSVTELAKKTPTDQPQPKAAKGKAQRQPQAQ